MTGERELNSLVDELHHMVGTVAADRSIPGSDLRRVLRFITKVVQVVDQAFQDVYATLIDVKYLTLADVNSESRLTQLRKDIDLLHARDRYRDAEQICSRLHQLSEQYDQQIAPIIHRMEDRGTWSHVFNLLNAYEGEIVRMVNSSIWELQQLLVGPFDNRKVESVRNIAAAKADNIRNSLTKLECVRDQILGLSGAQGFLELTETDRESLDNQVTVMIHSEDKSVTHGHRVDARRSSGQVAVGQDITQSITTTSGLAATDVAPIIESIKSLLLAQSIPQAAKERVARQFDEARAELESSEPNKDYIASTIKKATDVVKQAGGMAVATTQLTTVLAPVAQWLGKTLAWFGL